MSIRSLPSILPVSALAILLLIGAPAHAINPDDWTLEDVLQKVEDVNGGGDVLDATTNLRVRGKVTTGEITYDFLLLKKRPDKVRIHLMYKGRSIETGFDGTRGWQRVWRNGKDTVKDLSAEELADANLELDFDGPLIGDRRPGTELSLEGVERVGRTDYFIVRVETEFTVTRHYIDSRTFREWRTVRQINDEGSEATTVTTTFSQYRRHGTIWLAERVQRETDTGTTELIIVEDAEVDPGLLDRVFRKPKQWSQEES